MAAYTKEILIQKLEKLSASQESIQITSMWIQFHSQRKESVDTWVEQISQQVGDKRLFLLYLCNDLVQSKKKEFIPLFKQVLPAVFKDCLRHTKKETKLKIQRILQVWKERNIYPPQFIEDLNAVLNDQEDELGIISNSINSLKALMVTKQKLQAKPEEKDNLVSILNSEIKARQKIKLELQKLIDKQDILIQKAEKEVEELTVKNVSRHNFFTIMNLLLIGLALAQPGNYSNAENGFQCNPQVCQNSCCSQYGWCGVTPDHCGVGCQPEYGSCNLNSILKDGPPALGGPVPPASPKPPNSPTSSKFFAPYVDVTMADFDLAYIFNMTNAKYFNLAFITADSYNQPAWGGRISLDSNLYMKNIRNLRNAGGDVIVSFGGAEGTPIAALYTNETELMYKYARVVEKYSLNWIDFDIEGQALSDLPQSIIRAKAIYLLKQSFPKLKISYTLPVDTAGFEPNVIALLQATKMYFKPDVINLMTMDYGVNGNMGDFAIQSAANVYAQVTKIYYNFTLGITPMIGQNDYPSEVFTLNDAKKVLDFSAKTDYIGYIGFWSLNRDNGAMNGLGTSSMIKQDNYAFTKLFSQFGDQKKKPGFLATTNAPIPQYKPTVIQPANGVVPSSCGATGGNYACGGNYCCSQYGYCGTSAAFCGAGCQWSYGTCTGTPPPSGPPPNAPAIPSKFFIPYVDIMAFPTPEIFKFAQNAGTKWFVLAFLIADGNGNPSWGGQTAITSSFYLINIQYLRNMGGDICISFGGYNGAEIATVTNDINQLQQKYQSVIDRYNVRWLDFDIEGSGLSNTAAIDRRSQALAKLKAANPGLMISLTLPVFPSGLTSSGIYVIQSAINYGLAIDVVNIMAMDYGASEAPNGATGMGQYAIQAAQNTYTQVVALGFPNIKMGITPMIGVNDVAGETFTLPNAQEVFNFAQSTSWVQYLSFWSIQRDNSVNGPLYQSSQISQADYAFSNIFNKLSGSSSSGGQANPPPVVAKTTAAPVVVIPTAAPKPVVTNPSVTPTGSCPSILALPQSPSALPGCSLYVGYYESWADPTASLLCQVPSYYNVVILSFVDPMMQYTKGSYDISKTGLDFVPGSAGNLKNGIAVLRSRGARVLVSAGGWCFSVDGDATCNAGGMTPSQTRWAVYDPKDSRYSAAKVTQSLQAMRDFVDDFGLDGVDVDFETNGYPSNMNSQANCAPSNGGGSWVPPGTTLTQTCKADTQYINIVNQFRAAFPRPYLMSSAVHGYGAFGEGAYDNVHMAAGWCGCWWNGGMAIGMLKASGTKLDFLNVMSYDSNTYWSPASKTYIVNPNNNNVNVGFYDPTLALLAYQKYFTGPIILGVEPPMEGYPKDTATTPCKLGHCLTIAELQYLLGFISAHNGGGIMIWAIQKQPEPQYAAYPDPNAISSVVCQYFGLSNCGATIPLGVQPTSVPVTMAPVNPNIPTVPAKTAPVVNPPTKPTAVTNPTVVPSAGSCPAMKTVPQSPSSLPSGNLYVGYYETWADPGALYLCQVPSYYNVVILSFVDPMMQYTKGSYDISKTGLDFLPSAAMNVKSAIAVLRSQGARVLVSAGGWCFSVDGDATCNAGGMTPSQTRWAVYDPKDSRYSAAKVTQSLQAMRDFVDDFGLDGVDVDFETNGYPSNMNSQANCQPSNGGGSYVTPGTTLTQTCKADTQYINIVNQFRAAFPRPYLMSSAVHGYGAFGEGAYDNVHMAAGWCGCWWNGGMAIGMLKASGTKLDFLNVMSYDSNTYWSPASKTYIVNPNNNNVNVGFYDPTLALLAYQKYFTGPIILGVEPPMEGYPKDTATTPCKLGHCLTIAELQYLLGFISAHNGGGIMIWAIQKQPEPQYAAYPDPNAISSVVCQYFGLSNCGATFPLGVQAAVGPAPATTRAVPPVVTNPPAVTNPPVVIPPDNNPSTNPPTTQTGKLSVANKNFAPYCDILLYPTFDINAANVATGTRFFTLAFIQAGTSGNPAWGGIVDVKQLFYLDKITTLRNNGGDVIISFGGASGTELAHVTTNVATLQSQYQSVLNLYKVNYIDFDIEGAAGDDTAAIDRRHKALAALKAANPGLIISVTLPVLPSGLVSQGINILNNAVSNNLQYDVINIMTMDYGSGVAPDGANGMGTYSIQAAQNTYKQAQQAGMKNAKIGLTPMIGNNDVAGEVFTLANAQQVLTFAQTTNWVGLLAFWSINRDTSKSGALYASSGITQNDFDFAKIFFKFSTNAQVPSPVQQTLPGQPVVTPPPAQSTQLPTAPTPPKPVQPDTEFLGRYIWPSKIFAPFVDVSASPTFDLVNMKYQVGSGHYILGYLTAGSDNSPAWGGSIPLSENWFFDAIQTIRQFGGEPIITFGGPTGKEIANVVSDPNTLQMYYQNVIDAYSVEWINFDISTDSNAVIDYRNQVLRTMQVIDPNLRISYTLPVTPSGYTATSTYVLQSAINYGVRVDFVLLLTMNFGSSAAPNGATAEGGYVIQAATNCFKQTQSLGLNTKLGIVPMIGKNDVGSETFSVADAKNILLFANNNPWVGMLSFWSANRDNSASSGVTQSQWQFSDIFVQFEN